jgi:hypothetical protein
VTRAQRPAEANAFHRQQRWLAAVYVAGCTFRSFLPRGDAQRICLVDSRRVRAAEASSMARSLCTPSAAGPSIKSNRVRPGMVIASR